MAGRRVRIRTPWVATVASIALLAVSQWDAPAASARATASQAPLPASQAAALSTNVSRKVIVVLKDQVTQYPASPRSLGARIDVEAADQHPILSELSQTKAKDVRKYTLINAVAATVSPGEEARLAANPAVEKVVPDRIIHLQSTFDASTAGTGANSGTAASGASRTPVAGTCPAPGAPPLLEPQALQTIGADSSDPTAKTARSLGIDGSGVKVAFIADGLDINNADFIRPDGSHVFVDYKDFTGEGTSVPTGGDEAFLDASSIAAQGQGVYDISKYSALPLDRPCNIRIEGVAPGASLVGLDIFGAEDAGFNSSFLQAIDYAVTVDHVNVLNESLGNNFYPDDPASLDLIKQANDGAVAAGTTVTASSGDAGVTNTIGTPSTDPEVISTGATTTYQLPAQIGYGGFQFPAVTGYLNNNISGLSSSGFDRAGRTISLVAPGELNWALCSTNTTLYSECTDLAGQPSPTEESGGTSESAPLTAGTAALVIEAYSKTHHGSVPSPALVKQILTSTADDIQAPADEQGSGLLDAYRAVLAAESYHAPAPAHTSGTLLEATSQFNSVAPAGTKEKFAEHLTNLGSTPETVNVASRTLGAYSTIDRSSVTLSDTASPHSVDYQGITDNYEEVHFTVPSGANRLNGSIAFKAASSALAARVRFNLVDPQGRLADYSVPQGIGNYGDAQVADPAPGLWTAYIWSRDTADGGTTGPILFGASVAHYHSFGSVSPSTLTIAPGATGAITLTVTTPHTPGDVAASLLVATTSEPALAIPVTVRTLVPSGPTSFSGVLTGGNGRASFTGVTEYYQLDVPAGKPDLNAYVTLAADRNNQTYAWLIDPSGQAQAFQSNGVVTQDNSGTLTYSNTLGTNVHVIHPAAGRWTLIITFAPTVSGTALHEPFTVALDQKAPAVTATGVPHGEKINANHPAVVTIKVTNTGTAPEAYFVDGRTDATTHYNLVALNSAAATVPLRTSGNIPFYLVPTATTALTGTGTATGTAPIQLDLGAPTGDPDVGSGQGLSVSATVTGNPVTAGEWDIAPDVVGPFGAAAAASETVNTSLTATTKAFDSAVSSYTGDLWQGALGGTFTLTPVLVQPGQSATIPVTIAPTGKKGAVVSGVLYVDDDSLFSLYGGLAPNADTVAAIPYRYQISG